MLRVLGIENRNCLSPKLNYRLAKFSVPCCCIMRLFIRLKTLLAPVQVVCKQVLYSQYARVLGCLCVCVFARVPVCVCVCVCVCAHARARA